MRALESISYTRHPNPLLEGGYYQRFSPIQLSKKYRPPLITVTVEVADKYGVVGQKKCEALPLARCTTDPLAKLHTVE
jgi:hypothetical protein